MKKLMILGAGIYQVPLIKRAREMGIETLVASVPGGYPGFTLADKIFYEDTRDHEKLLAIAERENIDGIVTTGTDVAVVSIGRISDALGLHSLSAESAETACDKSRMKEAFRKSGEVNTADFSFIDRNSPLQKIREECIRIGFPVAFKAVDLSGSRGIFKVSGEEEMEEAAGRVRAITKADVFIIEKYLEGEEFGAQAFVRDGKLEFVLPHGDYVFRGDAGVPIGHYAPLDLPVSHEEIREQILAAVRAMGIDNCAINADLMLCGGKVYVLEIGARGGATQLVELTSLYYGFDYYQKIIESALGLETDFTPANSERLPNASHILLSRRAGVIKSIENNTAGLPGVEEVSFDYGPGDRVNAFRVGPDRLGHVITTGPTLAEARKRLFDAMDNIIITIEE